jgi:serine protein kinase
MRSLSGDSDSASHSAFIESLSSFSRLHRAQRWEGTFGEFLATILPPNPVAVARSSHQYIWDMLRWHGRAAQADMSDNLRARELFKRELFGIDEPLSRVVDYFKAAAAGSDVGRRLLLLLGPPSGGKSTLAILLKRGLEEYSRTDEGAIYAVKGSPMRENPLNLIPASLRAEFRERYGVEIQGELSPWARECVEREFDGDFVRVPVERLTHLTIRPLPISLIWSDRWTSRKSLKLATRVIHAPGPGLAPSMPPAAACSR